MKLSTSRSLAWVPILLAVFGLASGASAQSLTAQAPRILTRYTPAPASFGGPTLLYDQIQGTSTSGIVSQNNVTATTFNDKVADDFTVTAGQTWDITQMVARGFYTTASTTPGVCTTADVTFYTNGTDNKPGTVIQTRSVTPADVSGALTMTFPSVSLAAGTYWASVVCNGATLDLGVNGRWNWFYNTVQHMQPGQLRNDGGGFGVPAGWNSVNTLGAGIGPDFDFSLSGSATGTAMLPEFAYSPSPLTGTVASGGTSTTTLTLMNEGTADLTFSFPAFATLQRIAALARQGVDLSRREVAMTSNMPKGVEGYGSPGGTGAQYRVGGPDAFGYTFIDSGETGGPAFEAIDIAATGTPLVYTDTDDGEAIAQLPFAFSFYGDDYTYATVGINGAMILQNDDVIQQITFSNSATMPNPATPNTLLAPFWDDLNAGTTGMIYTETLGDGRFVIQWNAVPRFGSAEAAAPNTFQVILSPDGTIKYQYLDINAVNAATNTIGIENATGTDGLLVNANTAGYAMAGLAIQFNAPTRFIAGVSPTSGTIAPGGSTAVTVSLSGTDGGAPIMPGMYMQSLRVLTNDADEGDVSIPVELTVTGMAPPGDLEVTPNPVTTTLASGETGTATVTLTNNTDTDVPFSFPQYASGRPAHRAALPQAPATPALQKGQNGQANPALNRGSGGPDAFGYEWIDSNEPGGPTANFQDISTTGTTVTLEATPGCSFSPPDEGRATVTLPQAFSFYGQDYSQFFVNANGVILLDPAQTGCAFSNAAIPTAAAPNAIIAPFWDDLDLTSGGSIQTQAMPNGDFIVQWTDAGRFAGTSSYTFQVVLSPSGAIHFEYGTMTGTLDAATVGIENQDGTDGLQIAFNQAYVESDLAVLIQARPSFVTSVTPPSGTIPANGSVQVEIGFDATGLIAGQYTGDIDLVTPDSTASVGVVLNVTGMPTVTVAPSTVMFGDLIIGFSDSTMVSITNNGTSALTITSVTSDNPAFTVDAPTSITIAPGATDSLEVTFTPTEVGPATGTLTIVSNASTSPTTVALSGNGLAAPAFAATPGSLTFSVVEGTISAPQTLTLNNAGTGAGSFTVTTALAPPTVAATAPARRSAPATAETARKALTGRMPATAGTQYRGGEIVADGSFEAGTPNPSWDEASAAFGTPLCDLSCVNPGADFGPRTGAWWTWFGGATAGDVGSMTQTVTVPSGSSATLDFYLRIPLVTGGTGFVAATMDGTEVFRATYDADQAEYDQYTLVSVDASAYADGGSHVLSFESTTTGSGNFFVDDVSINVTAGLLLTATPTSGTVAGGGSQAIMVTADATNATPGTYQAEVRIATNDPASPTIVVPVTIEVRPFVANEGDVTLPEVVTLYQNYPNPVAQATRIKFALPEAAAVDVRIYDAAGRMVATLVQGDQTAGFHEVSWNTGSLASGVYFVRMQAGTVMRTMRLSVIR